MTHPALLLVLAGADWWFCHPPDAPRRYVGRASCRDCHTTQVDHWTGSHHDRAMDVATPQSVRGDFSDAHFEYQGVESRMFRRDGRYFIHTEGPDGEILPVQGCDS